MTTLARFGFDQKLVTVIHRIMVQVQSNLFSLYDRNPKTFVPGVSQEKPEDYKKAARRVCQAPSQASAIELPVVEGR